MSSPWKDLAVLIAVAALFLPIAAKADVAVLTPAKDVTIHEDPAGAVANGQGDTLIAGSTNDGLLRRSPMQFDVAGQLPAGAIINSVALTLTLDRTSRNEPNGTNRVVGLHLVTTDWNEGPSDRSGGGGGNGPGSGAVALGGDTTWIHTDFPNEFWNTPGGDFVGSAAGTTLVGTASGDYTWASTAGMVTDVQAWLDSPVQNMGWFLIGDEVDIATSRRFGSRQSASPPTLTIDYDPPANAGACCGDGQCAVVASAGACTVGTFLGVGTTCADCGGACCDRSGPTCNSDILAASCPFDFTVGATCGEVTCDAILGACCGSDASCSVGTAADCSSSGGVYRGDDSSCEVGLCPWQLTAYVDELPVPLVKLPDSVDPDGSENYTVTMLETTHQMHSEMPATPVWGYDGLYPGPTIEARQGQHTRVDWVNDLRTGGTGGLRSQHIWPVDTCPHGPNYWLDTARTVVHLHGAHVHPRYDGYPEYDYPPGTSDLYVYPNTQQPATLWYHDHALGITRLNVHLGLAGFYLLRNDVEDALGLPSGEYEVPVVVQDKSFNSDGTIAYPAEWNDTWFANHIIVNGKILPKMTVKRGKYRFRFLNGSGSRFYRFRVVNASGTTQDVVQIGTDGGLVDSPRTLQDFAMGPAERYEIVIDFEQLTVDNPGETEFFLVNDAPILYPGVPGDGVLPDVMRFDVTAEIGHTAALPGTLKEILPIDETQAVVTRRLSLGPEVPTGHGGMPPCSDIQWFVKTVSETRGVLERQTGR